MAKESRSKGQCIHKGCLQQVVGLLLVLLLLVACGQPSTATMPFTTIAQEAPLGDHPAAPLYAVVSHPGEWDQLRGRLPDEAVEAGIRSTQLNGDLIVVAFAGVKYASGHSITVNNIVQEGDQLVIVVSETAPRPDDIVEPATTLPYHLVAFPGESLDLDRVRTFVFRDEQGAVLSQEDLSLP